ncbi:M10 family metallopeptidase C-terminal domain-containing protein [Alsobacter sp. KACC 23698]|uniref:M10 family metallopeptidase C-terminal domain-containing protein n=1 Tax=Alsobacter sp. KACC 23698 TaxID=3149229 RepID=A0AAU7JNN8_9HYPH
MFGAAQSPDDVYVYTDKFSKLANGSPRPATLAEAGGTDTINAAAVTTSVTIDLAPGATSTIAGHALQIAAGTVFETAIGGNGADKLVGNEANNVLFGRRGHDTLLGGDDDDALVGGPGSDFVDGGAGNDVALFAGANSVASRGAKGEMILTSHDGEVDTLVNVERIAFTNATLALDNDAGTGQIFRLSHAALDRTPETQGLSGWVKAADQAPP